MLLGASDKSWAVIWEEIILCRDSPLLIPGVVQLSVLTLLHSPPIIERWSYLCFIVFCAYRDNIET